MRTPFRPDRLVLWTLAGLTVLAPRAMADEPPVPRLDRVDYARPDALPALSEAVGAGTRTQGVARQLAAKGKGPAGTLRQIVRWAGRNLRDDAGKAGTWRSADQILVDGKARGEADRALVIGAMARSAGIPTVWVKALPVAFVRERRHEAASFTAPVGRVFIEVHLDGRWQLMDPVTARLYDDYDPRAQLLPDDHVAFDKGADPYTLVLPNRFALWRAQVQAHAGRLRVPEPPWSRARDLLAPWRVYVTGRGGAASYASAACKTLGYLVETSFDSRYEQMLPLARGKILIVTCRGRTPVLPESLWSAWLPPGHREIISGARTLEKGWIAHRLPDGTRVVLITATEYGPVELAVSEALEG